MGLKFGKTEIARMAEVLDADHETVDAAALAALQVAEEVFRARAAYTVVGQLWKEGVKDLDPSDPAAIKVALGWYSTPGDAESAAKSLVMNNSTLDVYRAWILPVTHCTGAEIHKARKEKIAKAEAKAKAERDAKLKLQIEKYAAQREAATLAALEETA